MRAIGIDYGTKRTGIAIAEGDPRAGGMTALPFEMFENLPDAQLADAIATLVRKEAVDTVVVGLPLMADGGVSPQTRLTERFILALRQRVDPRVPIHRAGEFLSSHASEGKLAGHFTRNQKRQRVDALAAAQILQDWLDARRGPPAGPGVG
jgi:putative Holliday junction resolvase